MTRTSRDFIGGALTVAAVAIGCVSPQTPVSPATPAPAATVSPPPGPTTAPAVPPSPVAPPPSQPARATDEPNTPDNLARLARLRIDDSDTRPGGFDRELFPTWLDLDGDGCDAREDTLIAESLVPVQLDPTDCHVLAGDWVSVYDGERFTDPTGLDVDHVVPLAEAWRSGAHAWGPLRRAAFANDVAFPDHLIAVSASANRSKSDNPPQEWRPPRQEVWCRYATAWVTVKDTWALTVTTAERDALGQMLETC